MPWNFNLSPLRGEPMTYATDGDTLVVGGVPFDFSPLPEGGVLPRAAVGANWLQSDVTREGGVIAMTIVLPHGATAPEATRFPAAILHDVDGPVPLPPFAEEDMVE